MFVAATISDKDNLCDYCSLCFADCPRTQYIRFGTGVGNDNVTACSSFNLKEEIFPLDKLHREQV